jgi:hypothetical protein
VVIYGMGLTGKSAAAVTGLFTAPARQSWLIGVG